MSVRLLLAGIPLLLSSGSAMGASLEDARNGAIVWLERHQNSEGSWGAGSRRPVVTAEALLALARANRAGGPAARKAIAWLQAQEPAANDHRIRRVRALDAVGVAVGDEAEALAALAASSPGWGTVPGSSTTSYDTALALGILQSVGQAMADSPTKRALVTGAIRFDGGFAGDGTPSEAGPSDPVVTAEVVRALVGDPANLAASIAFIDGAGGGAPVAGAGSLELAARLAAVHARGSTDAALETALLGMAASSGDIWGSDAYAHAMGLLAVTTKPGVVFDGGPGVDDDGDQVNNEDDLFPQDPEEHADQDGDGIGDASDPDADGDGVLDVNEPVAFRGDPSEHTDTDGDGIGNNLDPDDDNDGVLDLDELEAGTDPLLADSDGDGANDFLDEDCPLAFGAVDLDGDGVCSDLDCDDGDPLAAFNSDADATCDFHDPDDDNDGFSDIDELAFGSDPRNPDSTPGALESLADWDADGLTNGIEQVNQTSPFRADTDGDGALDQMETDVLGVAAALDPLVRPGAPVAVFSSVSPAPTSHQPAGAGLTATASGGQPTPTARSDAGGELSSGGDVVNHAGFLPQTGLAGDLDGDGLDGSAEIAQATSHLRVDTDQDGYVDGSDGIVSRLQYVNGRDLDGFGFVDGELDAGTDPSDGDDHVGEPGDVAPWGSPDGRVDAGDAVLGARIVADPAMTEDLTTGDRRVVTETAADANGDGRIDAGDAVWILQKAIEDAP